jgi:hypothetical protein
MNTRQNTHSVFTIEQQVATVSMPQSRRTAAIHAARVSDAIVSTILRVCDAFNKSNTGRQANDAKVDVLGAV